MAGADMGEYIVGAYLKVVLGCEVVDYNARFPGGGLPGLNELDVVGMDFKHQTAYFCEVTTHIGGAQYGDNPTTVQRILTKHARQKKYAEEHFPYFPERPYSFWSPYVPEGYITTELAKVAVLELVINKEYTAQVAELRAKAKASANDFNTGHSKSSNTCAKLSVAQHGLNIALGPE